MEMFEEYICGHDSVKGNAEVDEAADKVFSTLFDFYQLVGAKWLGGDSEVDDRPPERDPSKDPPDITFEGFISLGENFTQPPIGDDDD